jgi:hypothetical protein
MTQIDCGDLQDRMPDAASGVASWTSAEAAHLANCEACGPEWQIVQAARRLGSSAARQIDPAKLALRVLDGVRTREKRSRWSRTGWVSGLAAAAILLVVVRTTLSPNTPGAEPPDTAAVALTPMTGAFPMAELEGLDAEQLEAVLEQFDPVAETGGGIPSMGDLDDQQLERVLRSLEG